jgi:hypothetical protein
MNNPIRFTLAFALLLGALWIWPTAAAESDLTNRAEAAGEVTTARLHSMPILVVELLQTINEISKYPFPTDLPNVAQVPHEELEHHACGGKCAVIKAAYVPEQGIYIDNRLDPLNNVMDRSILLHELVHHVQALTGRYADLDECERRRQEEMEAFAIQNAYLAAMKSGMRIPAPRYVYRCDS